MDFKGTPVNMIALLLVALAVCVLLTLFKRKVDSNLPLLFYASLLIFANFSDRQVNLYLFGGGLLLAFLVRFEFMNRTLAQVVLAMEILVVTGIAGVVLSGVFGLTFYR